MTHLTESNYYSNEADMIFMSASQFNSFLRCEAKTLAQLHQEYPREETSAMLAGSYLDAMISGETESFLERNADKMMMKNGKDLLKDYRDVPDIYDRIMQDEFFVSFLEGDKQTILTGEIAGVPWKAKLDIAHPERTVDFKTARDFKDIWDPDQHRYVTFAEYWRYDIQGAGYQEMRRQHINKQLPFYLAVVTKEKEPDLAVLNIPQDALDFALAEIEAYAPRFQAIKLGVEEPTRCGKCDYCKSTKKLDRVIDWLEVGM